MPVDSPERRHRHHRSRSRSPVHHSTKIRGKDGEDDRRSCDVRYEKHGHNHRDRHSYTNTPGHGHGHRERSRSPLGKREDGYAQRGHGSEKKKYNEEPPQWPKYKDPNTTSSRYVLLDSRSWHFSNQKV